MFTENNCHKNNGYNFNTGILTKPRRLVYDIGVGKMRSTSGDIDTDINAIKETGSLKLKNANALWLDVDSPTIDKEIEEIREKLKVYYSNPELMALPSGFTEALTDLNECCNGEIGGVEEKEYNNMISDINDLIQGNAPETKSMNANFFKDWTKEDLEKLLQKHEITKNS